VSIKFGFKGWAILSGLMLSAALVTGCNSEEPAPAPAPSSAPAPSKAPAKTPEAKADEKAPAPAPAPEKKDAEKK
jgi:hypothetical protein